MKLKISDILSLKPSEIDNYIDGELLNEICPIYITDWFQDNAIKNINYAHDTKCDCRSRDVRSIYYNDEPVLIYQNIGKGNIANINIIDTSTLSEMINYIILKTIQDDKQPVNVLIDEEIEVQNYNMQEFILEDNKLLSVESEELKALNTRLFKNKQ